MKRQMSRNYCDDGIRAPPSTRPRREASTPGSPYPTSISQLHSHASSLLQHLNSAPQLLINHFPLNDDCLAALFRWLDNETLETFATAFPLKNSFIRSYLSIQSAQLTIKSRNAKLEGPSSFPLRGTVEVDGKLLIPVLSTAEPFVWVGEKSILGERNQSSEWIWSKQDIVLGSMINQWRGLDSPIAHHQGKIIIFGGSFTEHAPPSPEQYSPQSAPARFAETPQSFNSFLSSSGDPELSNRLFILDTETWIIEEPEKGDSDSSQESSKSQMSFNSSRSALRPRLSSINLEKSVSERTPSSVKPGSSVRFPSGWPCGLRDHSLDILKNRWLVVFGGRRNHSEGENDVWLYDLENGTWTAPQPPIGLPPPTRRLSHSSSVVNDELWIFGGAFGTLMLNDLYKLVVLNAAEIRWTQILDPSSKGGVLRLNSQFGSSTDSLASTQLDSQATRRTNSSLFSSQAELVRRGSSFVTPSTNSSGSESRSSRSTDTETLTTTGSSPEPRAGAHLLSISGHHLVILGGRRTFPRVSAPSWRIPESPRSEWDEVFGVELRVADVFNITLGHWTQRRVYGADGIIMRDGIWAERRSSNQATKILILGRKLCWKGLEEVEVHKEHLRPPSDSSDPASHNPTPWTTGTIDNENPSTLKFPSRQPVPTDVFSPPRSTPERLEPPSEFAEVWTIYQSTEGGIAHKVTKGHHRFFSFDVRNHEEVEHTEGECDRWTKTAVETVDIEGTLIVEM